MHKSIMHVEGRETFGPTKGLSKRLWDEMPQADIRYSRVEETPCWI